MPPRKPHWFRARDAFIAGTLLAVSGMSMFCTALPAAADALGRWVIVVRVGIVATFLLAAAAHARTLWQRRQILEPFIYIAGPFYAVMVHPGSYGETLTPSLVTGQFFNAFAAWQQAFGWTRVRDFANGALFWVWFKPNLAGTCGHGSKMLLPGLSVARMHKIVVSYRRSNETLDQTTFQHELGHVIQGGLTGSWSIEAHHDRAAHFGLS